MLNPKLKAFLKKLDGCVDCTKNPTVLVTDEAIPLCKKHWGLLVDSEIQWQHKDGVKK